MKARFSIRVRRGLTILLVLDGTVGRTITRIWLLNTALRNNGFERLTAIRDVEAARVGNYF